MRIISGEFRGRRLSAPKGSTTRPTTDRVREALFSALTSLMGPQLGGGAVLDPFAGSGALALEAVSRGCVRATVIESDRRALITLSENVRALGADSRVRTLSGNAFSLAARGVAGGPFALILLDPPYTLDFAEVVSLLEDLGTAGSVEPGAVVTWEHAAGAVPPWPDGYSLRQRRAYGSTEIDIAVWEGGGAER